MKKRIIASILLIFMCTSLLPLEVFANLQNPIQWISENSVIGHSRLTGGFISPLVELEFKEPIPSDIEETGNGVQEGNKKHETTHYQLNITEYPSGTAFQAPSTPSSTLVEKRNNVSVIPVQKATQLKNGKLYKMSIIPYHLHQYDNPDGTRTSKWAPQVPNTSHPYVHVLTDFNTTVEGKENSLEVTWEDSGYADMDYTIGYIQGNYEGKSLDEIRNNTTGDNIQYISSSDIRNNAEKYRDPQTGESRFRYTIKNNIVTGQMYSVFVVSNTGYISGEKILKNDHTPKIATATTQIKLSVFNIGKDKIRLEWSSQLPHLMDGSYKLEQTLIKEYKQGETSGRIIVTLNNEQGADLGYYEYREPKESTYYQLVFIYKSGQQQLLPEPQSAKVLYVPGELRVKPLTPEIPKPVGKNTKITDANKNEYLLPDDALAGIPVMDWWKNDHTFHANVTTPPTLNIVWSTYMEDLSLLYDLWISDDLATIQEDTTPIQSNISFSNGQNAGNILYNRETNKVVGFQYTIGQYYNAQMEKQLLVPNKVYYVKVVAKKQYGDEFESSLPVITPIMFDSEGKVFSPPMLSKPPLQLEPDGLGKTSITVGWLESWNEILAKEPEMYTDTKEQEKAKEWNAKVYTGTTTGPAISFIKREGATEHILKNSNKVEEVKTIVNNQKGQNYYQNYYIDRTISLGENVNYEYKVIAYDEIIKGLTSYNGTVVNKLTVEEYIEMLMKNEQDPNMNYGWEKMTPKSAEDEDHIQWKQHTVSNLQPNTSYVIFIRPYSYDYDGSKLVASLPTWITATTLPDGEMPEGRPTVPLLSLHSKGDTHISVTWQYDSNFDYEMRYSRLEDPDKAQVWPFEIGTEIGDPTYVEHGGNALVTINGLFPDTTYHIWIRAKQKKGNQVSAWSNPVSTKTDTLGAPTSPTGLGIASYQSILEVGKDFQPVGESYITVEWQRNPHDKDLDDVVQDGQRVQKQYRYIIEIADNPEFLDVQKVTVSKETVGSKEENAEILSRSMVYFEGLIANRPYYIRAKTVLIAHDTENNREIIMESQYTNFIRIITKPSQDEYDGGDKVNEVVYPEKIKQTYDGTTWTYEILDTQKVIHEMVTGNQYRYVVPVERYRGIYNPKYRVVRIPQPIVTALINRRMQLEIKTDILTVQIQATSLASYISGSAANDMIEFTFETLSDSDLYSISMGYEYQLISTPEQMSIRLKGNTITKPITKVDQSMKIKINMPSSIRDITANIGGYTYSPIKGAWEKGNSTFDLLERKLSYTTGTIGIYVVYERNRTAYYTPNISQSMENVLQNYDILGLGTKYTPDMIVGVNEYMNIMLGIAEKRNKIAPDAVLTSLEKDKAQKSGLHIESGVSRLTQEAAISGIVRLYELNHGVAIRPSSNINVRNITARYQNNIQKAYTLGIIYSINPNASITYREFFDLIEAVIE